MPDLFEVVDMLGMVGRVAGFAAVSFGSMFALLIGMQLVTQLMQMFGVFPRSIVGGGVSLTAEEKKAADADAKARQGVERARQRAVSAAWELAHGEKPSKADRKSAKYEEFNKWYRETYRD